MLYAPFLVTDSLNFGWQSGFGGEGVAEGEEGGFGVELGVEGERTLGEAVFSRAEGLEPGVAVGEAPG